MSPDDLTIVLVEDNPADRRLVVETLQEGRPWLHVQAFARLADAATRLADQHTDCVLLDLSLPDAAGLEGVDRLRALVPDVPLIVLSGLADEDVAAEAVSRGAQDYLIKGESDGRLITRSIRYAIERKRADADRHATQRALAEAERRQRTILAGLLQAEEAERARIATALHDDTVQVMTACLVALDRLAVTAAGQGHTRFESAIMLARTTLEEATDRTRRLMFELRPAILHERGLTAAITILTDQTGRETGARSTVEGSLRRHTAAVEELVYRSVQEALANVRKHAEPHHIAVRLTETADWITCEVRDDGRGFDPDRIRSRPQAAFHLGLDALVERIRVAGGQAILETAPGRGTHLRLTIPSESRPATTLV